MRDLKGRFIKGNKGFWLNKKRPNLIQTGAVKTMFKKGQNIGEENIEWQGDKVGYYALHSWLKRNYGKPDICRECGSIKNVQWANLSYKYKRDIDDWIKLCYRCHRVYDRMNGWGLASLKFKELQR